MEDSAAVTLNQRFPYSNFTISDFNSDEYKIQENHFRVKCEIHNKYFDIPNNSEKTVDNPCRWCNLAATKNTEFIERSKDIYGSNKFDYSKTIFKNKDYPMLLTCLECGLSFRQSKEEHFRKFRIENAECCPYCVVQKGFRKDKISADEFLFMALEKHRENFDYSNSDFSNMTTKITIICHLHGEFLATPSNHISSNCGGCSGCITKGYSAISIEWLEYTAKESGIKIQHALNGGEFRIPNTKFRADGYCKDTNTIYEFHGDYWHGNPRKYNQEKYVSKNSLITFGDLYQKTLKRESIIKELGYKLVIMWEDEWRLQKSKK